MELLILICQIVFWTAVGLILWTFAGYPAVMIWRAHCKRSPACPLPPEPTRVSIVLACYNEAQRLPARIANLLATDYPADKLEVVIVSDGSDDDTASVIAALKEPRVTLVAQPERHGKSACVGFGVEQATGEIIVLCDARQSFQPTTIPALVSRFADSAIGAVSGELEIAAGGGGVATGVGAYWRLERKLRHAEALLGSAIGCTGAVYAIRKSLFRPIPADTLLDDVVIPMQIVLAGKRVIFETAAKAYDPQALSPAREEVRKQRTLAGNLQMLLRYPHWLLPWRNSAVFRLICHKYLRLAGPFCMLAALVANILLWQLPLYQGLLVCQGLFYALALIGRADAAPRPARLISAFVFLNLQVLRGCRYYFFGSWKTGWR